MLALSLGLYATEAAAGPKVITKCKTLHEPGAYVLGKNLTVQEAAEAARLPALGDDFISVDLDGFTITGSGAKGAGIRLSDDFGGGGRGFEIRGGTIAFFARGIDLKVLGGARGRTVSSGCASRRTAASASS